MTPSLKPEPSWIERLGSQTGAFSIVRTNICPRTSDSQGSEFDWDVEVRPKDGGPPLHLLVEAKSSVTPNDVLRLPNQTSNGKLRRVPMLCCPVISPRVAGLCESSRIGYLDAAGNCHIAARGLFIHIEGRKNPHRVPRQAVDLFATKSSRVTRVLLTHPNRGWQVQKLAHEAKISLGLASRIKQKLVEQAFVEIRDDLVFVRDAHGLLNAWANAYKLPERRSVYILDQAATIEQRIAEWCGRTKSRYALTGLAGAWRVAPMVRHNVPSVYVQTPDGDLAGLLNHLDAKTVDSGANLQLWIPPDNFVFYSMRTIEKRNIVSPIQLYLDLSALHGRGREAADEVLEKEILAQWPR